MAVCRSALPSTCELVRHWLLVWGSRLSFHVISGVGPDDPTCESVARCGIVVKPTQDRSVDITSLPLFGLSISSRIHTPRRWRYVCMPVMHDLIFAAVARLSQTNKNARHLPSGMATARRRFSTAARADEIRSVECPGPVRAGRTCEYGLSARGPNF